MFGRLLPTVQSAATGTETYRRFARMTESIDVTLEAASGVVHALALAGSAIPAWAMASAVGIAAFAWISTVGLGTACWRVARNSP
jgi:hypothetical protein